MAQKKGLFFCSDKEPVFVSHSNDQKSDPLKSIIDETGFENVLGIVPDLFALLDHNGTIIAFGATNSRSPLVEYKNHSPQAMNDLCPSSVKKTIANHLDKLVQSPNSTLRFSFTVECGETTHSLICLLGRMPSRSLYLGLIQEIPNVESISKTNKDCPEPSVNLLEHAPFAIFITNILKEDIRYFNYKASLEFGLDGQQVIGKSVKEFYLRQEDRKTFLEILYSKGMVTDHEITLVDLDHRPHKVLMSASFIEFEGEPCVLISVNDISNRRRIEEENRMSEERYRFITENTQDVIWVYRPSNDTFTYVSPSIKYLRGLTVDQAMQESMKNALTPESYAMISEEFAKAIKLLMQGDEGPISFMYEVQQPTVTGKKIWVEISAKFRINPDGDIEVIGVSRNIQERKKTENEVLYLSTHDQLTGLFNRRYYEDELKRVDIEKNLPITLIMADVNGLKLTNDAFGHSAGDKILKTFADMLMKESSANDIVARVGGDEFVVIMKKTGPKEAESFVNRISRAIASKQMVRAILSVSFGLKTKVAMSESIDDIYKQSEDDMYRNKLFSGTSFKNDILNLITKSLFDQNDLEHDHAESVSDLCKKTGIALGMSDSDIKELGLAGLLHDIGKIAIPESLLLKVGVLTDSEIAELKRHPEIGYQILRSVSDFANIAQFILDHHERVDGTGYPRGLKGKEIPLQSRIISIVEAYDALVRKFPYRKACSKESAVNELMQNSGKQFDAEILALFIDKVLQV